MNVTVVLVLSDGCGPCKMFKERFYEQVTSTLTKMGVTIKEFRAPSPSIGLKNVVNKPKFLSNIYMFPTILLVRSDVYNVADTLADSVVFGHSKIFNANITPTAPYYTGAQGQYTLSNQDVQRFVNDYISSTAYMSWRQPVQRSPTASYSRADNYRNKNPSMGYNSLSGVRTVNLVNTYQLSNKR